MDNIAYANINAISIYYGNKLEQNMKSLHILEILLRHASLNTLNLNLKIYLIKYAYQIKIKINLANIL